jgi:regulator of protease activity HflC (stomatin/prohibitin superfamily)
METGTISLIVVIVVAVLLLFFAATSVRIVAQWERMVVKRFGQTNPGLVRGPGLRFLIPFVDEGIKVDLREIGRASCRERV